MEMEKTDQVIKKAAEFFLRYGIKSVSMDDIARELKMSKKTLYKHFDDKQELVFKVVDNFTHNNMCEIREKTEESNNAIDELLQITSLVEKTLRNIHPSIHYDLEKYYPDAWAKFEEHKFEHIYVCILENIKRGVQEKLFRGNVNAEIIAKLHVVRMDSVFDPEVFNPEKYPPAEVHKEIMIYHIRGIASEQGIDYLKQLDFSYE